MQKIESGRVEAIARERISKAQTEIDNSLLQRRAGNPLASERDPERLAERLMSRNEMTREEAVMTVAGIKARAAPAGGGEAFAVTLPQGAEATYGATIDFTPVSFLERGRRAARTVGRVVRPDGYGSGFLVAPGLFLTNNHVLNTPEIASRSYVEFDYELGIDDSQLAITKFSFDPSACFVTDAIDRLDFTLIAVGARIAGQVNLDALGCCPLSAARDKHAIGEVVNIVQHPQGRLKEVVLRENALVARTDSSLLYVADTQPGSSGSPVYNNQWQVVALHHWGGPYRALRDPSDATLPREVNEGLRVSAIVAELKRRHPSLPEPTRTRVAQVLEQWSREIVDRPTPESPAPVTGGFGMRVNPDGSATWSVPVEITINVPLTPGGAHTPPAPTTAPPIEGASTPSASRSSEGTIDTDYSDRGGYEPGFIPGYDVPLPKLSAANEKIAARNSKAKHGDYPFELPYHHFSSVVNAKRGLAFFTACNINGSLSKYINRQSGVIQPLDPSNTKHGLEESLIAQGAEATEKWWEDNRLVPEDCLVGQDFYDKQKVPGYPTSAGMQRTYRIFQRGHLVRRLDPAWGGKQQAQLGEADTFHFTNCVPQIGFFNMGTADRSTPRSGGGRLWRAVENLVLRNARTMRTRVTSFTGPIFADDDPPARGGVLIPMRFFKVAVWADDDGLRSLGMIADQSGVVEVWPEALLKADASEAELASLGAEAFEDPDQLERVDDFLSTIIRIESLTGIDFGDAVRDADIRSGQGESRPKSVDDISFKPKPPRPGRGTKAASKGRRGVKKGPAKKSAKKRR